MQEYKTQETMKSYILLLILTLCAHLCCAQEKTGFIPSDMLQSIQTGDKAALLMVHFGSTYPQTRMLTLDALNRRVMDSFPELEMREAYTSRIVIRRLKEVGLDKQQPLQALAQLRKEAYTHVIVQSSHIIEGLEMETLRKEIAQVKADFKDIRCGNPLLYSPEDYEALIRVLTTEGSDAEASIFIGHGSYTPATAQYAMLDYMLKAKGFSRYFIGTIEGYPSLSDVEQELRTIDARRIRLQPLMLVAGDHAINDIAGEMKETLEAKGYEVEALTKGLGEYPAIQDIFVDHIRFSLHHKKEDITERKTMSF
jgi:sirohydrochlorin cobaltochelatase